MESWSFPPKPEDDGDITYRDTLGTDLMPIQSQSSEGYTDSMPGSDVARIIRHEMVVIYLYQQQANKMWINDPNSEFEGSLMKDGNSYIACPQTLAQSPLAAACKELNVQMAISVNSRIVKAFFTLTTNVDYVRLRGNLRIQILPTIRELGGALRYQFAAFIAEDCSLIVWDDDHAKIIARAVDIEQQLVEISYHNITGQYPSNDKRRKSIMPSTDLEVANAEPRPRVFINCIMMAFTLTLVLATMGLSWMELTEQSLVDHNFQRFALVAMAPVEIFLCLFFMQIVVGCLFELIGPVSQLRLNSKYYSGTPPRRLCSTDKPLPHITIQCPIYNEGLHSVIRPTMKSIEAAISTYEMQGGTANILVHDDGMQAGMTKENIEMRKDFYREHNIGWIARPRHNPKPDNGSRKFVRRGKFKKASNMNYGLMVSLKVESKLELVERHNQWATAEETMAYRRCLAESLEELDEKPWVDGNIRIGDYILLIDSDTMVPEDCLLDAVSEMEQYPEVGILQYNSGVMLVAEDFFINGIAFFTNLIYTAIAYVVANGDMAPFVGHNAVLRWKALQEVAYFDEDQYVKFWSECSVSEDFDMSLRLQALGYTIRLANYTGDGFKEGVSLTVYDELTRWEKYAYGCSEILFQPIRFWPTRGPFTPIICKFLMSSTPITTKITTLGYIGTYFSISSAWIAVLLNYFLVGWFNGALDHWYIDSFRVYFGIIFIFTCVSNIALAVLRYRLGSNSLVKALFENFKWVLLFAIFFGGISCHLSKALLCHLLEIDISWTTTCKEVDDSNFFKEVPKLIKAFWFTFLYAIVCFTLMMFCAFVVPWNWRINELIAILPLAISAASHFLLPIALNPALMRFTW